MEQMKNQRRILELMVLKSEVVLIVSVDKVSISMILRKRRGGLPKESVRK